MQMCPIKNKLNVSQHFFQSSPRTMLSQMDPFISDTLYISKWMTLVIERFKSTIQRMVETKDMFQFSKQSSSQKAVFKFKTTLHHYLKSIIFFWSYFCTGILAWIPYVIFLHDIILIGIYAEQNSIILYQFSKFANFLNPMSKIHKERMN